MDINLYYAPIACSLVPYVALTEADANFNVRPINIRKKHHMSADYRALNPKHKVPLLIVDDQPLSENVAIQLWIARSFPKARLLPDGPWGEAQGISLLAWCASGIHPHLSRYNAPLKFCDVPGTEDSTRALAKKALFDSFRIADELLENRNYFFDHFTTADTYFFWCFRRTKLFDLDLSQFKHCQAHFERLRQRESVKGVLAYERQVQAEFV